MADFHFSYNSCQRAMLQNCSRNKHGCFALIFDAVHLTYFITESCFLCFFFFLTFLFFFFLNLM